MVDQIISCHFRTQVHCFMKTNKPTLHPKGVFSLRHGSHVPFRVDTCLCKQGSVQTVPVMLRAPNALHNMLQNTTEFYVDLLSTIFQKTSQLLRLCMTEILFRRLTRREGRGVNVGLFQSD